MTTKLEIPGHNLSRVAVFDVLVHPQLLLNVEYINWQYNGTKVVFFYIQDILPANIQEILPANGYTSKLVPIQTNWSENSQSNSASSKNLKIN